MSTTDGLNLAHRPFANTRPVARVAILLWVLSALLLAGNVALFWGYFAGSGEQRARLQKIDADIVRNGEQIARMEGQVEGLDLARQNERVLFLNEKIAERTFSWSLLFDRVAAAMPPAVRLTRLTPESADEKGGGRRGRRQREGNGALGSDGEVMLTIGGEAQNDEALLQFVDNLFAHPAFDEPNPSSESKNEQTGVISFNLRVAYLPAGALAEAPGAAGVAADPGAISVEEEPVPSETPGPGEATEAAPPTGGEPTGGDP